jgi:hypothetical protein
MRNVWVALLIVLCVTVVAKAPAAQTSSSGKPGNAQSVTATTGGCDTAANTVRVASRRLVAGARFTCANPGPDGLTMTVALQKRSASGAWTTVASQKFAAAGVNTTRARTNAARTRNVSAACAKGVYRTTAVVTSVRRKKSQTTTATSGARTNPCG